MNVSSVDLLPSIFDQVVRHESAETPIRDLRQNIVTVLRRCILTAAAAKLRDDMLKVQAEADPNNVTMETFDRLSGFYLSRTELTRQIASVVLLEEHVVEVALLLIEAQIDLRFRSNETFSFGDVTFGRHSGRGTTTAWCQNLISLTLQASMEDKPSIWNRLHKSRPEAIRVLVQGLQFGAALREAAPYSISIARGAVESQVSTRRKAIRLLHISDLHMVEDLTNPARGRSPTLGQKKHNFETAKLLGAAIDALQPKFDLLVATGDLTTDGTRGSLGTMLDYVQGGSITGDNKNRIALVGLGAGTDKRLLLPGNHDRFEGRTVPGQKLSYLFEDVLGTPRPYPYLRAFRPPTWDKTELTLLFFVFNSNLPVGQERPFLDGFIDALSQGRIGEPEVREAVRLARDAKAQGRAPAFNGEFIEFDPENSVSIALLHHHPVAKHGAVESGSPVKDFLAGKLGYRRRMDEAMKLVGADFFLDGCLEAGIRLVLFGHNHYRYQRLVQCNTPSKALRAFCCPTTLELSEKHGNGFYVFDFPDKDTFAVHFYVSPMVKGSPLAFSHSESREFRLDDFSPDEIAAAYPVKRTTWPAPAEAASQALGDQSVGAQAVGNSAPAVGAKTFGHGVLAGKACPRRQRLCHT